MRKIVYASPSYSLTCPIYRIYRFKCTLDPIEALAPNAESRELQTTVFLPHGIFLSDEQCSTNMHRSREKIQAKEIRAYFFAIWMILHFTRYSLLDRCARSIFFLFNSFLEIFCVQKCFTSATVAAPVVRIRWAKCEWEKFRFSPSECEWVCVCFLFCAFGSMFNWTDVRAQRDGGVWQQSRRFDGLFHQLMRIRWFTLATLARRALV